MQQEFIWSLKSQIHHPSSSFHPMCFWLIFVSIGQYFTRTSSLDCNSLWTYLYESFNYINTYLFDLDLKAY